MSVTNRLVMLDQLIRNDHNLRLYVREGVFHVKNTIRGILKHHSMHDDPKEARKIFRDIAIEYDMISLDIH